MDSSKKNVRHVVNHIVDGVLMEVTRNPHRDKERESLRLQSFVGSLSACLVELLSHVPPDVLEWHIREQEENLKFHREKLRRRLPDRARPPRRRRRRPRLRLIQGGLSDAQ